MKVIMYAVAYTFQVVKRKYNNWEKIADVNNARFSRESTKVCLQLGHDWSEIDGGWKIMPQSNPEVGSLMTSQY